MYGCGQDCYYVLFIIKWQGEFTRKHLVQAHTVCVHSVKEVSLTKTFNPKAPKHTPKGTNAHPLCEGGVTDKNIQPKGTKAHTQM